MKKQALFTVALGLATTTCFAEECYQMVERKDLKETVINGERVYVVTPDAVIKDCNLYQKARTGLVKAKQQNQALTATIEELNNKYKDLYEAKESYYQLVLRYEKVLNKSSDLVGDFETNAGKWASLHQEYVKLADDYDKLSDTYRDIAMNFSSPVSFELGGGVTEDHGFAGLVGVGIHRFTVWGLLQPDNNGLFATYTFPWSSL